MKILFIQTGGTIDKDYPHKTNGWAFEFGQPAVNRLLTNLNPTFDWEVITAFQKDSLEITNSDRKALSEIVNNRSENRIIITHGTDTLIDTAEFLNDLIKDKTIVFTGAMRPERFSNSDAPLNLGCAIAAVNLLDEGCYVSMHGIVKPANEIKRDLETGKFF